MSDTFQYTAASLRNDRWRPIHLGIATAALLTGAWVWWFVGATVPLYAVSRQARVESAVATYPVDAPADGEVTGVAVRLGQAVRAGDLMIELDTRRETLRREDASARTQTAMAVLVHLREQIALQESARAQIESGGGSGHREADKRFREADTLAAAAEEDARRGDDLHANGLLSSAERNRLRAEATRRRAAADVLEEAITREQNERSVELAARGTALAKLKADYANAEAEWRSSMVANADIAQQIDTRLVRAPVSGTIGQAITVRPGSIVRLGDHLTQVVPPGRLIVAAWFSPADAVGRIHAGQRGRLRADGYAPIENGFVTAIVERIAREPRNGLVRVEMRITNASPRIPLQHALTGTMEVETERVSPAALFLRAVGKRVGA